MVELKPPIRATIPIAIQPGTKLLRLERILEEDYKDTWRIWLNANIDFTLGTCLVLHYDGSITNNTQNEDGTETIFQVKGPD